MAYLVKGMRPGKGGLWYLYREDETLVLCACIRELEEAQVPALIMCSPMKPVKVEEWSRKRRYSLPAQERWFIALPLVNHEVIPTLGGLMLLAVEEACRLASSRGLGRLEQGQKPIGANVGVVSFEGKGFLAVCCLLDREKRPIGVCTCSPLVEIDAEEWAENMDETERLIFRVLFRDERDIEMLREELPVLFSKLEDYVRPAPPDIV